ncbi:MAG: cation diffusion facilitator family transporter, partial [Rhizobacter sp.]|nr:cation diffusion facilitator family transporter [Rhizobacter sp.]
SHGAHSDAAHSDAGHSPTADSRGARSPALHSHAGHSASQAEHGSQGHAHAHPHAASDASTSSTPASADLNLRSAYVHVLADAGTSVLAIAALVGGMWLGWSWLDPVMGLVGAVVVASWAKGLIGQTSSILLDREMDAPVVEEIREACETTEPDSASYTRVTDLHVWRVGQQAYACALTLVTHDASLTAEDVRRKLAVHAEIVHATIEINRCA